MGRKMVARFPDIESTTCIYLFTRVVIENETDANICAREPIILKLRRLFSHGTIMPAIVDPFSQGFGDVILRSEHMS